MVFTIWTPQSAKGECKIGNHKVVTSRIRGERHLNLSVILRHAKDRCALRACNSFQRSLRNYFLKSLLAIGILHLIIFRFRLFFENEVKKFQKSEDRKNTISPPPKKSRLACNKQNPSDGMALYYFQRG